MIEFLQNFHFLRPWALLFLFVPLAFYWRKIGFKANLSSWENVCDANLLSYLLIHNNKGKKISIARYLYTGIVFAILAIAGPTWKKIEIPTFSVENPSMFVLSLAQDMQLTDITPSRLERAKYMISDISDGLSSGQFGLMVYSQEPYVITPLTDDAKIIKSLLEQVVPDIVPDYGDRPDRAISLAIDRFKAAGYGSGNIVLLASDIGQRLDFALEQVKEAAKSGYVVHVVDTSYSGNEKLKMLADLGNGVYVSVKEPTPQKILKKINELNQKKISLSQNLRSDFLDYGYYLVFVVVICMLPFFRKGLLTILFCGLFAHNASAGFLLNQNQEGLILYNNQKYEEAAEIFNDPLWRGISYYKLDKKEEALKEFNKLKENDNALYNAGVVYVKLCKYKEALEAFNQVLKINPKHQDALYNKGLLDDLYTKAKDDPSLLNCDDNQQQNNNQKQDNSGDNRQNQKASDNNEQLQNDNSDDSNKENEQDQQNDTSKNIDKQSSQQEPSSNKQTQDKNSQQNQNDMSQNNKQNSPDNKKYSASDNGDGNKNYSKEDNNSVQNADQQNKEKSKAEADDKKERDDTNSQQLLGATNNKEGDEYDEEALAVQRRYREIPEDEGGLLREFIKKEYMKDRYHDENK